VKQTNKSLFPFYEKVDLSEDEVSRTYIFPGNEKVTINEPQFLIVSDNGHRLLDADGISHYIPYGWIHLFWLNKKDRSFYCEDNKSSVSPATITTP